MRRNQRCGLLFSCGRTHKPDQLAKYQFAAGISNIANLNLLICHRRDRTPLLVSAFALMVAASFVMVRPTLAQDAVNSEAAAQDGAVDAVSETSSEDSKPTSSGALPTVNIETTEPEEADKPTQKAADNKPTFIASPPKKKSKNVQASSNNSASAPPAVYSASDDDFDSAPDGPAAGGDVARGSLGTGATDIDGYVAGATSTATKTNTLVLNTPQSISIVTKQQAQDQGHESLGQVLQYVPGVTVQQGEGHRDQISIRGQETNADFYTDGVRDDIQYFRDLYNIEAVEVLKGPNAMIFGRGGGGGIVNRVTKKADWQNIREASINFGMYDRKRVTIDVGQGVTKDFAVRLNAMYENSENFRDFFELERVGINPTVAFKPTDNTKISLSYEYRSDNRTVDRGVPSLNGKPFKGGAIETFYGNPDASYTEFTGHVATATLEHKTDWGLNIRSHTYFGDYDKLYQNIFASEAVNAATGMVELDGYRNQTFRQSLFNQTELSYKLRQGEYIQHTLVAGTEIGYQETDDFRFEPSFGAPGGSFDIDVPVSNPTSFLPVFFDRFQRSRHTELNVASFFVQDQLEISKYFQVIGGLRFDRFDLEFTDLATGVRRSRVDEKWSPRLGVVFKPFEALSLYATYSKSFLPFSGDQFVSLSASSVNLEPEEFENKEIGFKWELAPRLFLTAALYKLDRSNAPVTVAPGVEEQVGLTRTQGAELSLTGHLTDDWQISASFSHHIAEVVVGNANRIGNEVESTPHNTAALWTKYQFTKMWGAGIGVVHQSEYFAAIDNTVTIPGFTRVDAALYFDLNDNWSAQLNVENLLNTEYFASAHNNNNISPGAPISAYATIRAKF